MARKKQPAYYGGNRPYIGAAASDPITISSDHPTESDAMSVSSDTPIASSHNPETASDSTETVEYEYNFASNTYLARPPLRDRYPSPPNFNPDYDPTPKFLVKDVFVQPSEHNSRGIAWDERGITESSARKLGDKWLVTAAVCPLRTDLYITPKPHIRGTWFSVVKAKDLYQYHRGLFPTLFTDNTSMVSETVNEKIREVNTCITWSTIRRNPEFRGHQGPWISARINYEFQYRGMAIRTEENFWVLKSAGFIRKQDNEEEPDDVIMVYKGRVEEKGWDEDEGEAYRGIRKDYVPLEDEDDYYYPGDNTEMEMSEATEMAGGDELDETGESTIEDLTEEIPSSEASTIILPTEDQELDDIIRVLPRERQAVAFGPGHGVRVTRQLAKRA